MKFLILILFTYSLYGQNILGKVDKFDLPELGIYNMKAKIDTGAKTSSIHCLEITPLRDNFVKFRVLNDGDISDKKYITKSISRISNVKSSNGKYEQRYFIRTNIIVYKKTYDIEISLSSRENMVYSLLIGRELLQQGFIVDISKKYLSCKSKK